MAELQQQIEEDEAVVQDTGASPSEREAARERVAERNEELARLQTQIAEKKVRSPFARGLKKIFKKYGFTVTAIVLAAGVTIGAVVGAISNALKAPGKGLANGLKEIGRKTASLLPGLLGSIVFFFSKLPARPSVFWLSTPGC